MSPAYDPRRTRPRPTAVPDPEPAPVDALLGPEPATSVPPSGDVEPAETTIGDPAPNRDAPRVAPGPSRSGAPSAVWQLAPLLALLGVASALVWWLTRRRQ